MIDPVFFEEMSKLLAEIIKERKANAISYAEYLKKIAALAEKVNTGISDKTPETLVTIAQRSLYNNLGHDEKLALLIDKSVKEVKRDGWRGNLPKEREIKAEIYEQLVKYSIDTPINMSHEPAASYGLKEKVEIIFKIIREQAEY